MMFLQKNLLLLNEKNSLIVITSANNKVNLYFGAKIM